MRTRDKLNIFLNLYTIRDFAILMNIDLKELVNWCKNPIYKTQILPKKTGGARFLHVPDSF